MAKKDFYDVLGLSRQASADDIKKAYRKMAMKYHPDKNLGDKSAEDQFKSISEAYEILSDPQKRAAYDRMGHQAFDGGGGGRSGGFEFSGGGFDAFEDMLDELMGGGMRGAQGGGGVTRGSDLRFDLEISLEEAFKGNKTRVTLATWVGCGVCSGTGAEKGSAPTTCGTCRGRGAVRSQQGFFMIERTCPTCHGAGKLIEKPCKPCHGVGRVHQEKTLAVTIPAGVDTGSRIRLAGEGEAGARGGGPGDLYIFVSVKPHPLFQREERDIHCRVPLSMVTAALGGSIEVPTIEGGRARLVIPEGAQTGQKLSIKGQGMPSLKGGPRGDMHVHVMVETPVHLTKRQKELLQEFGGLGEDEKSNPNAASFWKKVKKFWE